MMLMSTCGVGSKTLGEPTSSLSVLTSRSRRPSSGAASGVHRRPMRRFNFCGDSAGDWGGTRSTGVFARHNTRYAIEPGREPSGPWLLARPITITPARRWSAIDAIESAGRPLSTRDSHSIEPANCSSAFAAARGRRPRELDRRPRDTAAIAAPQRSARRHEPAATGSQSRAPGLRPSEGRVPDVWLKSVAAKTGPKLTGVASLRGTVRSPWAGLRAPACEYDGEHALLSSQGAICERRRGRVYPSRSGRCAPSPRCRG